MSAMTTCPCGVPMPTKRADGTPRRYHSATCANTALQAARDARGISAAARADDAETLLAAGNNPAEVSRRLGLSLASMGQIMRRAGRPDLAVTFEREDRRARRAAA